MINVNQLIQLAGPAAIHAAPRSYIFGEVKELEHGGYCVLVSTQDGTITVPVVWSQADVEKCDTEKKVIDFVHDLIKNAIDCLDDLLIEAGRRG